jgi:hypothetical protein
LSQGKRKEAEMWEMTDTFGFIGRGKKIHFLFKEDNQWFTACANDGGDWLGKPSSPIEQVTYLGWAELDDQRIAVDELLKKKPNLEESQICLLCYRGRF